MNHLNEQDVNVENVDSPFTEIFSILTKYQVSSDNVSGMAYLPEEVAVVRQHVNNATEIMLQGLQDVGRLLTVVDKEKMRDVPHEGIGHFISATCNLIEALNRFN